jgi:hypothetical protein
VTLIGSDGAVTRSQKVLGIALVAHDRMHTRTALDLTRLCSYQTAVIRDQVVLNHHGGTVLSEARQSAAKELLEEGCTHILYVDSDMAFPPYAAQRMMQHDVPVVAANCSKRVRPLGVTARIKGGPEDDSNQPLWPVKGEEGLVKVETVGTALMMVKAEVFTKIEWPWFSQPWYEETERFVGEDVFFCGRLAQAEIPVMVDQGLSWQVRHIGEYRYGMQDVLDEKAAMDAGLWENAL